MSSTPVLTDPSAAVTALWDRLIAIAKRLGDDDWARATPCTKWDVHDLLAHCAAIQLELDGGDPPDPPPDWDPGAGTSPFERWTEAGVVQRQAWEADRLRADLRSAREGHATRLVRVEDWDNGALGPMGRTTEKELLLTRCYDLWVHLQDLHMALDEPIDVGDTSEAALAAHRFVLDRVPWMFAKGVGAVEGDALRLTVAAPVPLDAVVVMRGGRARLETATGEVASTVRAAPEALTLMVSGRGEPSQWSARGLLDWSGELADRFVEKARLF